MVEGLQHQAQELAVEVEVTVGVQALAISTASSNGLLFGQRFDMGDHSSVVVAHNRPCNITF